MSIIKDFKATLEGSAEDPDSDQPKTTATDFNKIFFFFEDFEYTIVIVDTASGSCLGLKPPVGADVT